ILRNEASAPVSAEWSQAATSHAGRIYAGGARYPLPREAAEVFRELHEQMRDEVRGVWFSARIDLPDPADGEPGTPLFTANYSQRVYWNSDSMLTPPQSAAPIPSDAEWSAE